MNEKNLVICSTEIRYASGLSENISARHEFALRVHICTSLESILQFSKGREIHILIVDEEFSREERKLMKAERTFVLTEETCLDLGEQETEINKFQSAERILAKVFETYYEQTSRNILKHIKKREKQLIAVYSPIHRIGKTTFALALGKELAKEKRTIYLNMESYADVNERFARSEGRNLGDLFYYMYQEGGNMPLRISTMVSKMDELDYIPPFLISHDLRTISVDEWQTLLTIILDESIYEVVVLDLGESVQGIVEILRDCNRIYMPVLDDEISKSKVRLFEDELDQMQLLGLKKKIHQFTATENMEDYARKLLQEKI